LNVLAPLSTNLAGVQVSFDGRPAFVVTVFPGKIVCIAPVELAGQASTQVQVIVNGALSNVLRVGVTATSLGLLSLDGSGAGLANARNADGSLNSATNPAPQGSVVTVFLTGVGVTNPPEVDGVAASDGSIASVAQLSYGATGPAPALPGFVPGIFSFQFAIPTETHVPQQLQVVVRSDSSVSQNLYIYVH
jgi:uncharacterized protein (TIGR03437 family)